MKSKAVSIKQLAKMAAVAPSTISKVVNNNGRFSEHTRERVLSLIKKTGYTPNIAARALRTRKAQAIGLVVPDISNEFFLQIVNAVEKFFFAKNYSLFIGTAGEDEGKNRALLGNLLGKGVDGLIYISRFPLESEDINLPTVYLDRITNQESGMAMVSSDNFEGGKMAAEVLLASGTVRPVLVCNNSDYDSVSTIHDRIDGFKSVCAANQVKWTEKNIIFTRPSIGDTRVDVGKALRRKWSFDGIFAISDQMAMGTILALEDAGVKVPGDVNVVGFDGISFSEYFKPALTTIRQDTALLGTTAAELLLSMLGNGRTSNKSIRIPVKLLVRDSTRQQTGNTEK